MKSHLLADLQPDLAPPRSTLGAEIQDINQSIGRTTLLIYNYCQGNCRWYFMIIPYFLKLRLQTRAICVKVFFSLRYPVRKPGQRITGKLVGQLLVPNLAMYYILQVLSYFIRSIN